MFSRKDERDTKSAAAMPTTGMTEMKQNGSKPAMRMSTETVSKLGAGMVITGNIMCDGALQIFGHVLGDIHATQLAIGEGAHVEGNVVAQDTMIDGFFKAAMQEMFVTLKGNQPALPDASFGREVETVNGVEKKKGAHPFVKILTAPPEIVQGPALAG